MINKVPYDKFKIFSTLEEFKTYGNVISLKYYYEINDFIKLGFTRERPPYFRLLPIIGSASNSTQFRFMLIDYNNDTICLFYKVVTLFSRKQIRIFGYPISENGNSENVLHITRVLNTLDFVRFMITDESELSNFESVEHAVGYSDYYYDLDAHNVLNSKYKHHHKVHKMLGDEDFTVKIIRGNTESFDNVGAIRLWDEWVDGLSYVVSDPKRFKEYSNLVNSSDENVLKTIITYRGKVMAVRLWYYDKVLNICRSFYNCHNARTCDYDIFPIMRHITHIHKWFMAEYIKEHFDTNLVFIAGAEKDTQWCQLRKHKEEISQGKVSYWVCMGYKG